MERTDVLIIGAGLAGLSAAYHLGRPFIVLENESTPGGLCRSVRSGDSIYDYTGHLLHLQGTDLKALIDELLPGAMTKVQRKAAIYSHDRFVSYPFQANFHPLPKEVVRDCLLGFIEAQQRPIDKSENFREWALAVFGEGICRHFMFPYNEKLLCNPLDQITVDWVGWSVPRPSLETIVNGALGTDTEGLGYNPHFYYPKKGGIEVLPRALADKVENIAYEEGASQIDVERGIIITSRGREIAYESLITTMPLPDLLTMIDTKESREWAKHLLWVNVHNLNLTLRREAPWDWQWIYLPEPEFRCYRIGVSSNISSALAPPGCCTLYTEVSYRPEEQIDSKQVRKEVLEDLRRLGLLEDGVEVINEVELDIDPAYVIHDEYRLKNLDNIHDWLKARNIFSIGRWGRWGYSGMKDAILQGRQVADILNSEQ